MRFVPFHKFDRDVSRGLLRIKRCYTYAANLDTLLFKSVTFDFKFESRSTVQFNIVERAILC